MVRVNDSVCIHHTDRPAVGRCRQCHVPYCSACETAGPRGTYCSVECRAKHEKFASQYDAMNRRARNPLRLLLGVVLIAASGAVVLHFLGVRIPILSDLLGGG